MVVKEKEEDEEATAVERREVDGSHVEPEAGLGNSKITLFGTVTTVLLDFKLAREVDDIAKQGGRAQRRGHGRAAIYQS